MKETERENTEYKDLKYLSLAPQASPDYESSSKLLYEKIIDDSVYNIGIIAQYGAGKSSLIKTFKQTYENKQKKSSHNNSTNDNERKDKHEKIKTLNISLATFNIDEEVKKDTEEKQNNSDIQTNEEQCKNVIDQAIEKSILQQMLYKKERNDLPKSRIKRIKSFSVKKFLSISLLSIMILLSIFALTLFGMSLSGEKMLEFKGSDVVYGVVGFCLLTFFAGGLFQFIEVTGVKLKDIELSFASECNESLLNKFLDEVIYFFQKTKYNVVIFEDLDRFNNLSIFVKLRELNIILNSNQKLNSKKKITFVYAIKNTMFSKAEDRAKFFDFIISVLPVLSPINASSKIVDGLEECGFPKDWLPDDFVDDISNYINDMRVLNSTINDCVQLVQCIDFSKISEKDLHKQNMSIFSLMAYKNIYPQEFIALEERTGELYDILARVSIVRDKYISDIANKIDGNNNYIEKLKYQLELNKSDLLLLAKGAMLDINNRIKIPKGTELSDNIDYKNENMDLYFQVAKYETLDYYRSRTINIEYLYATVKQINEHIEGLTMAERYNVFVENNAAFLSKQEAISTQNKKYQYEIDNYERNDFEFIKKYPNEVLNSKDSDFLRMLLSNGYLDENYRDYLSKSGDSFMAENDRAFIKSVIQNEPLSLNNLKLTSPSVICNKLSLDKFNRAAILNNDFVNYMFSDSSSNRDKRDVMRKYIQTDNEDIKRFIVYYFNSEIEWPLEFIKCLLARKDLFRIIKESNIDDAKIDRLLTYILEKINIDIIQKQDDVKYLIKRLMVNEDFKRNIVKFSDKLQFLQSNSFRISNLSKYEYSMEALKIIDKNRLWALNLPDMIYILTKLYNYSTEEILLKGYSLIVGLNSNIKGFILYNISYYIHNIMLVAEKIELDEEDFVFLLENDDIDLEDKYQIIRKHCSKVDYFDCEDDILQGLLENDKITISLEQLIKEIETKEQQLANSAIAFLMRNKSEYEEKKIKSEKAIYAIANFDEREDVCALENLCDFIEIKEWDLTKIQNEKALVFLVDSLDTITNNAIEYISNQDFLEAQKHLASKFIGYLLKNNTINTTLAKTYVKFGQNMESRIEIYKLEDIDCVEDYSDAKQVMNDILKTPIQIAQRLYNKLMTMSIDKKTLFISQIKFMDKDTIWERLPRIDSCYSELVKNRKISIDKSDMVLEALHKKKLLRKTKKGYAII